LDGLKEELPSYQAKVMDLDLAIEILQWWHQNVICHAGQPLLIKYFLSNHPQQLLSEFFTVEVFF